MPTRIRLLKRAVVQIFTVLAPLMLMFFGYASWAAYRGEGKAIDACAALPPGMPYAQAVTVASRMNVTPQLRMVSEDSIGMGFEGALLDRWFCQITFVEGKVAQQEVRLID